MVDQKVSAGLSTVSLGGVSVVAYVLAVLAFVDGQRDEVTILTAATGTVALVTMAAGRFWQAVAKTKTAAAPKPPVMLEAVPCTQVWGLDDEPGDPDALPDHQTDPVIPDDGDDQAVKP